MSDKEGHTAMPNLKIVTPLMRVWTPEDAAQVRELADEFPAEVGSSVLLDLLVERAR